MFKKHWFRKFSTKPCRVCGRPASFAGRLCPEHLQWPRFPSWLKAEFSIRAMHCALTREREGVPAAVRRETEKVFRRYETGFVDSARVCEAWSSDHEKA